MLGGEVTGQAFRLPIDDEIDLPLPVKQHILAAMPRHECKPHLLEERFQYVGPRCRELNKLKAHQPHRVFVQVGHGDSPREWLPALARLTVDGRGDRR